ncbi:RNA polymerase sigma factor [Ancylomarina sp. 16SWW S1-10-2]|uniref:RNA polymerase sigma factor n=1 Tax=Ancylomarina sp. 16SWW S1-10-2 TaxID=2499681 RepID=UPI0012ADC675|nr:sigma-70 family RNA polymerase sigma factor [Ancylomarina sp. 16SWW S1-10-2]MRT94584.1 sigma-70 family RNA polymerase sigma factor [Ancylomarina sp. 16SWW S1-10-2]
MSENIELLVKKANSGDKKALEKVVVEIQDLIYNLSFKMLLFHEDASDATQEILIKVITHLSTFKGNSQFKTWVYRVATNYLLTKKGKNSKAYAISFDEYADVIDTGQSDEVKYTQNEGELALLEEDIRIGCTQGLLLCLNESDRLVYILGMILEFNSVEASEMLGMTPENFRKKLSRSKTKIQNFLSHKCGVVNPNNPCRCKRNIDFLIENKGMDPKNLAYGSISNRKLDLSDKLSDIQRTVAIYREAPNFSAPEAILKEIRQILNIS